jgi:DNA helicase-4
VLKDRLQKTLDEKFPDQTFTIKPLSYEEIVAKTWRDCKESVSDLSNNCAKFIQIAKTYHLTPEDIKNRLMEERWTGRQRAFSSIALPLFERYEADLHSINCIDFQDMINLAIDELHAHDSLFKNVFDHILIDEYQDISTQRSDIIKALMQKKENFKLEGS